MSCALTAQLTCSFVFTYVQVVGFLMQGLKRYFLSRTYMVTLCIVFVKVFSEKMKFDGA